jgi:hypothetical protein
LILLLVRPSFSNNFYERKRQNVLYFKKDRYQIFIQERQTDPLLYNTIADGNTICNIP